MELEVWERTFYTGKFTSVWFAICMVWLTYAISLAGALKGAFHLTSSTQIRWLFVALMTLLVIRNGARLFMKRQAIRRLVNSGCDANVRREYTSLLMECYANYCAVCAIAAIALMWFPR